jgi:hypothetical protein
MPPFNQSKIFTLSFKLSTLTFNLALGTAFAFGEADLHKIKVRETLDISHNDLNTTDDNAGLTESFSTSVELHKRISNFCF